MTSVIVRKNEIDVVSRETYTAGSVNVYTVNAKLSNEWKALSATPVFRAGSVRISTVFDAFGSCVIPHEVLEHAGQMLEFGVFGVNESGAELPTIWAKLDYIREGTSPGENAKEPTPSLYDQLVGQVGAAVNDARGYADSATASANVAVEAKTAAAAAKTGAETARDAAAKSETAAGTAAKDSQTASEAAVKAAQGAAADKASADTAARNAAEAESAASAAAAEAAAAKTGAVNAANAAETARDAAAAAKTGAEAAKTGADTARAAAETAKTGAETARAAAETARDAAQRYAGDAQEALSGAQGIAASKLDKPATPPTAAGKVLRVLSVNEDGTFVCEWSDDAAGVTDVRVAGESIVSDGVADVPVAETNKYGVSKTNSAYGVTVNKGFLSTANASQADINNRATSNRVIVTYNMDYAFRAAMCDGKGTAWTADEQAAARERMGIDKPYELIEDITLTEEATEIIRTSDTDGTPYSLDRLTIKIYVPANSLLSVTSAAISCSVRVGQATISLRNESGISKTTDSFTVLGEIYNKNGFWNSNPTLTHSYSGNSMKIASYPGVQYDGILSIPNTDKINNILIKTLIDGAYFPIGTNIKIYGVRA